MNGSYPEQVTMTPDEAVRALLMIEGRTKSLLQRTVGLTWMFWSVVSGGIFVSYEAIGIADPSNPLAFFAFGFAWLPWVLLGIIATAVLWRSVALVMPTSSGGATRVTTIAAATFLTVVLGGLAVITLANVSVDAPSWAMFAVGIGAAVVGGSGLTTESRPERIFWLGGGVFLAFLSVAISLGASWSGQDPQGLLLVVGPLSSTALLFSGGLYTASS
jgi:hypothetical protein